MPSRADTHRLAADAARHHGLLRAELLDRLGVSTRQRHLAVERGEWRRCHGSLVIAGAPDTFELRASALLDARPSGVLSHQTSLRVHGTTTTDDRLHLTVPPNGPSRCPGVVLHRAPIEPVDMTSRGGFRVTTLERTLIDLGATMPASLLQACIEDHLARRATTFDRLERTLTRVSRRGRRGIARARAVLAAVDGVPPTESELERRFLRVVGRASLPVPERQVTFAWSTTEQGRVDFWFAGPRLVVELDGRRYHARTDAFERDRRRDQLALLDGVRTVRITHRQLVDDPDEVIRVLRALMSRTG